MKLLGFLAQRVGHLYPFLSGCGTFANSAVFRWVESLSPQDQWVRVQGFRAIVPSGDLVGRSMKFVGDLDRKVSRVIDRVVRPGDVTIDVGANLGLVTLQQARLAGPQGQVIAFEPQDNILTYLRQTLAALGTGNVTLHEVGLARENGSLVLSVPEGNAGAASFAAMSRPIDHTQTVTVLPLDQLFETSGFPQVSLMKIDVEGFEAEVMAGAEKLFAAAPPHVVLLEEHQDLGSGLPDSLAFLADRGYRLFALPKVLMKLKLAPVHAGTVVDSHDYVAVSPKAPAEICKRLGL